MFIIPKREDWEILKPWNDDQEEEGGLLLTVETQSSPAQSDQMLFKLNQSQRTAGCQI